MSEHELPKYDGKWVRVKGKLYDLNKETPPESESTEDEDAGFNAEDSKTPTGFDFTEED